MEICPENLYIVEVKLLLSALSSPQPINGQGYWISTSWLSNAKKYYDALPLPDIDSRKIIKGKKTKLLKIRQRRGSDCLPPWPQINSEIICQHSNLATTKGTRAKRRIIDKFSWRILRKFYPKGLEFKTSTSQDCTICLDCEINAKLSEIKRLEEEKRIRQIDIQGPLYALSARKSGVPSHCVYLRGEENEHGIIPLVRQPLRPGLYHLAPKAWLKIWRQYIKDPTLNTLPLLDCTDLLCSAHGLLVIPPHVEEYLQCIRRSLLQGLTDYPGALYEILSGEEWDALQEACGTADFSVRFSCDGDHIQWSLDLCRLCSPFHHGHINVKTRLRSLLFGIVKTLSLGHSLRWLTVISTISRFHPTSQNSPIRSMLAYICVIISLLLLTRHETFSSQTSTYSTKSPLQAIHAKTSTPSLSSNLILKTSLYFSKFHIQQPQIAFYFLALEAFMGFHRGVAVHGVTNANYEYYTISCNW
eukprot:gene144-239_t